MKQLICIISIFLCSQSFLAQDLEKIVEKPLKEKKINTSKPFDKKARIDTSYIQKKEFNHNKIEDFKSSDDFIYERKEEEPGILQRFWNWIKESVKSFLRNFFNDIDPAVGVLSSILRVLPYILLAIGLFFIVRYFANIAPKTILEGKNESLVNFSDDEELLQRDDLETLLAEAVSNNDYRLAIRFYYLIILKKLSDASIIDWQQQKTNKDYIKELSEKRYLEEFKNSTKLYDFVWYGKFELTKKEFQDSAKKLQLLITKIV